MTNQLDQVKKEITRLEVGIKSSERDLKKSNDKVDSFRAEVTELEARMKELQGERDQLVEQNKTLQSEINGFKVEQFFGFFKSIKIKL